MNMNESFINQTSCQSNGSAAKSDIFYNRSIMNITLLKELLCYNSEEVW